MVLDALRGITVQEKDVLPNPSQVQAKLDQRSLLSLGEKSVASDQEGKYLLRDLWKGSQGRQKMLAIAAHRELGNNFNQDGDLIGPSEQNFGNGIIAINSNVLNPMTINPVYLSYTSRPNEDTIETDSFFVVTKKPVGLRQRTEQLLFPLLPRAQGICPFGKDWQLIISHPNLHRKSRYVSDGTEMQVHTSFIQLAHNFQEINQILTTEGGSMQINITMSTGNQTGISIGKPDNYTNFVPQASASYIMEGKFLVKQGSSNATNGKQLPEYFDITQLVINLANNEPFME